MAFHAFGLLGEIVHPALLHQPSSLCNSVDPAYVALQKAVEVGKDIECEVRMQSTTLRRFHTTVIGALRRLTVVEWIEEGKPHTG